MKSRKVNDYSNNIFSWIYSYIPNHERKVKECGNPKDLSQDSESHLYKMLNTFKATKLS